MKKTAIVVVGEHHAGKSRTINQHLKPKLGVRLRGHKFTYNDCEGYILSQTREEREDFVNDISKYSKYDILVLATRPKSEKNSLLVDTESKLKNMGFKVNFVQIIKDKDESFYKNKASEIMATISKQCV
jgi:hypothetical protein